MGNNEDKEFFTWACSQLSESDKEKLKYFFYHLVKVEHSKLVSGLPVRIQLWYFRNRKDIISVLYFLSSIIIFIVAMTLN